MRTVFLEHLINIVVFYLKEYKEESKSKDKSSFSIFRNTELSEEKRALIKKLIKTLNMYRCDADNKQEIELEISLKDKSSNEQSTLEESSENHSLENKNIAIDNDHLEYVKKTISLTLKELKEIVNKAHHKPNSCESRLRDLLIVAEDIFGEMQNLDLLDQPFDNDDFSSKPLNLYIFCVTKYLSEKIASDNLVKSCFDGIKNNPSLTNVNDVEKQKRKKVIKYFNICRNNVEKINPEDTTENAKKLEKTLVSQALQKTIKENKRESSNSSLTSEGNVGLLLKKTLKQVDPDAFEELYGQEQDNLSLTV